jgi:hypothetical protein
MKRPVGAAATTGPLAAAVGPLARGIEAAGVIAIMGIAHPLPRKGAVDAHAFATVTVALADVAGAFPESVPGAQVAPVEFGHPQGSYRGVRIRRVSGTLTVQYLVRTEHGVLAITFTTPQVDVFERLGEFFDKVAATCSLDTVL